MAIIINNYPVNADEATFNTNPLSQIKYNGVVVWESASFTDPFWIQTLSNDRCMIYSGSGGIRYYYSRDKVNWYTYTSNNWLDTYAGEKIYFRYSSNFTTGFKPKVEGTALWNVGGHLSSIYPTSNFGSWWASDFFVFQNIVNAGELILPTTFTGDHNFFEMFLGCAELTTPPALPAINLAPYCYYSMFEGCTKLNTIPALPATTLPERCYGLMFKNCASLYFSETYADPYLNAFRIPDTGTGTVGTNSLTNIFTGTGGTFTGPAQINTTYYTSNSIKR